MPTLAAILVGLVVINWMTPIYQATSTVLIESSKSRVVSIEEVYPGLSADR